MGIVNPPLSTLNRHFIILNRFLQELGTVFRRLGERPSDKELKEMVDEVDIDKNGTIEFEEFLTMMANRDAKEKVESQLKMFCYVV